MNYSRRNEPLRYKFEDPLEGTFQIIEIDGMEVESKEGQLKVVDISPQGLKVYIKLDLPVRQKEIRPLITLKINDEDLVLRGKFVWRKAGYGKHHYGISLQEDEAMKNRILAELKKYAKHRSEQDK